MTSSRKGSFRLKSLTKCYWTTAWRWRRKRSDDCSRYPRTTALVETRLESSVYSTTPWANPLTMFSYRKILAFTNLLLAWCKLTKFKTSNKLSSARVKLCNSSVQTSAAQLPSALGVLSCWQMASQTMASPRRKAQFSWSIKGAINQMKCHK